MPPCGNGVADSAPAICDGVWVNAGRACDVKFSLTTHQFSKVMGKFISTARQIRLLSPEQLIVANSVAPGTRRHLQLQGRVKKPIESGDAVLGQLQPGNSPIGGMLSTRDQADIFQLVDPP